MQKLVSLITATLLVFSMVACSPSENSPTPVVPSEVVVESSTEPLPVELEEITVSEVTRSVFYAPQYAAITNGFFEDEGLDVTLITGQGSDKVMVSVLAEQVEIGLSGPETTIYVYNEGRENHPVIFSQLTKRDGSFLLGREPIEDFSWDMLEGSYILGGRKGGMPQMTLEYVLKQNDLVPNVDVTVDTNVQFALMAGAFSGGQGDYVALFEPTASMMVEEGKGYIVASIGEESGEIPYTCYYSSKDYIAENPEVIQKFTNAIYKGQQWVDENSALDIAKSISSFFPDTDIELLETVTQRHKDADAFMTNPVLTEESFDRLHTVIEQAGVIEKRADYTELVDNSFAEKAIQ